MTQGKKSTSLVNNVFYNGTVQATSILLNVALMPYVTRVLGADALGINSFGQAIAGYFVLLGNLGITVYGAKAIAERRDDNAAAQQMFSACISYQVFFNFLSLLLYNVWVIIRGEPVYFLFDIIILTSMTDLSWAYTGMERFDLIAIRNFVIKIVGTALIFCFVRDSDQLPLFVILQQGVLLASNVVFWLELPKISLTPVFGALKQSLKKIFRPAVVVFIPSIFTSIYLSINKVMLGYLSTIEAVAIYDYPNRLVRIAITFIGIIGTVMMPRLAYLNGSRRRNEYMRKVRQLALSSMLFSIPVSFLLILLASPLCDLLFSNSFAGSDTVLSIVAPTTVTSGLSLYLVYVSIGRMKKLTMAVAFAGAVNVAINFAVMPSLASTGAAISLMATEIAVHCILLYHIRDILNIGWLLRHMLSIAFCAAIAFSALYFVNPIVSNQIINCLIITILFLTIYSASAFALKRRTIKTLFSKRQATSTDDK